MRISELLDCPFCGSKARLLQTRDMSGWWYGECMKCDARQTASQTSDEAAAKWNKRITDDAHLKNLPSASGEHASKA